MEKSMVLNTDVILEIMSFLSLTNLKPIMRTCRTLHSAALPIFLRHVIVPSESTTSSQAFCDFFKADLRTRSSLIKSIVIPDRPYESDDTALGQALAEILQNASNIKSLEIHCADNWQRSSPSFSDAIASLTKVENITLWHYGDISLKTLSRIESPLRKIHLKLGSAQTMRILPSIHKFSPTLDDLAVAEMDLKGLDLQFSNVSKVAIAEDWSRIEVDKLIHTFPNLRDFTLSTNHHERFMDGSRKLERLREANLKVQGPKTEYPPLRYLGGDPTSLYILALDKHVPHVYIFPMTPPKLTRFWAVVEATRPKHLGFGLMCTHTHPTDIRCWIPESISDDLTHLTINLDLLFSNIDLDELLDAFVSLLRPFKISYLHLIYTWVPSPFGIPFTPEQIAEEPMVMTLKKMDYAAIANKLAAGVPSMRYIFLDVVKHREPAYFENVSVHTNSSAIELRRVPAGEAEEIIQAADAME